MGQSGKTLITMGWVVISLVGLSTAASGRDALATAGANGLHGTLLLIGGGLDNDNRPVDERFLALAGAHGPAHVVIVTAATGDQNQEMIDKTEALHTWAPGLPVVIIRRETLTAETVAAIDQATALFFTGGDQQRITDRYRPGDTASPEWLAMQRLLARDGVIAGSSAGDVMMGDVMFLGGGSTSALGIIPPHPRLNVGDEEDEENPAQLGPRLGPGMHFLPWAITDSHFFERQRIGRLVAALELSGHPLGIGVGEDACVEIDLASGDLRGVAVSESLLINATHARRRGLDRTGLMARLIHQGDRLKPAAWLAQNRAPAPEMSAPQRETPTVESGQNRQLAAWRLFRQAAVPDSPPLRQLLDGYSLVAFPAGDGNVAFEIHSRP